MNHHCIVVDSGSDLVECETLRQDDRARKRSIIALFDEHTLGVEIDRCVLAFSRDGENIARESNIDERRIHSSDRSYDNELFGEIENIDRNLPNISFMISFLAYFYIDTS